MGVKPGYVPSAGELTAHVRTGVDGAIRWVDRTLDSPTASPERWNEGAFYARMMLMRSLERGELLGWVLQRDGLAESADERAVRFRQVTSYWSEARPSLHQAMLELRRDADLQPHTRTARDALNAARDQLADARGWLASLADGLAANSLSRNPERALAIEKEAPETSYGLDRL